MKLCPTYTCKITYALTKILHAILKVIYIIICVSFPVK